MITVEENVAMNLKESESHHGRVRRKERERRNYNYIIISKTTIIHI